MSRPKSSDRTRVCLVSALVVLLLLGCETQEPYELSLEGMEGTNLHDALLPELRDPEAVELQVVAKVVSIDGGDAVLDRGARHGVRVRQVFEIYRPSEAVELPFSDEVVYQPQETVARAVVRFVDESTARVSLISDDVSAVVSGLIAVSIRYARPPNLPPALRAPTEGPSPEVFGRPAPVAVALEDEPEDWEAFEWEATAGYLASPSTSAPANLYYPPASGEEAIITVRVRDRADQEDTARLEVAGAKRLGVPAEAIGVLRTLSPFGGEARVVDVSFAPDGSSCVLESLASGSRLVFRDAHGAERARVCSQAEFSAVLLAQRAIYLLSPKPARLLRYPLPRTEELSGLFAARPRALAAPGRGNALLVQPVDMALTSSGYLYVLDAGQRSVQLFEPSGRFLVSFGVPGGRVGGLLEPVALAAFEDQVLVLDNARKMLLRYRRTELVQEIPVGGPGDALLGLGLDPKEQVAYVLEAKRGIVKRVTLSDGSLAGQIEPPVGFETLSDPVRLRVDPSRRLHVIDRGGLSVARFEPDGAFAGRQRWLSLRGEVAMSSGPGGELVFVDGEARAVYFLDSSGWIRWRRIAGEASAPVGPVAAAIVQSGDVVVFDRTSDALVVFDRYGKRLETSRLKNLKGDALGMKPGPSRRGVLLSLEGAAQLFSVSGAPQGPPLELPARVVALSGSELGSYWRAEESSLVHVARGERVQTVDRLDAVIDMDASVGGYLVVADSRRGVIAVQGEKTFDLSSESATAVACDDRGLTYLLRIDEDDVATVVVLGEVRRE